MALARPDGRAPGTGGAVVIECILCKTENRNPGACAWPICRTCQLNIATTLIDLDAKPAVLTLLERRIELRWDHLARRAGKGGAA